MTTINSKNRPLILLAGFWENQVADMRERFPDADFKAVENENISEYSADALVSLTQTALDSLFTPSVLERCGSLRWVHASSAGIDEYLPHLDDTPFVLTCGRILQGPPVADHAMALLLALTRRLPWAIRGVGPADMPRPTELNGKQALVIGLGGIGMGIAERAAAFGMRVNAVTENNAPILSFVDNMYFSEHLVDCLPTADVVFISAPLTPVTHKTFSTAAFAAMKDTAYLINVSRGPIVDTDALVAALDADRFEGVGFDVTDPEPLPDDHPLKAFERVLITPHYAGTTTNHQRRFELIDTNIRRFINGHPLVNTVDKTLGF